MVSTADKIHEILMPILQMHDAELVELEVKGMPGSQIVKVFVDTDVGITLEKCEFISRTLADQLDIEDVIPGKYRLEVSSPGLSRPLKRLRDFKRNINREIRLIYGDESQTVTVRGKLLDVTDQQVALILKSEKIIIPFSKIKHGEICLPW